MIAAVGSFAAISLLFGSPLIAAVLILEIAGLGRSRAPLLLLPGLLAAGIGSLVYIGLGSWAGLSTSAYSIDPLELPDFARPSIGDFLWTIPLAVAVAVGAVATFAAAKRMHPVVAARPYTLTVAAGLAVAGLAIGFSETTDRGVDQVLFSGQESLPGLVADAGGWSVGALVALIAFKGLAYSISLASFRGGPIFPALLARRRGRHPGVPPAGARSDAGRRRRPGCSDRGDAQAAPDRRAAGGDPHRLVRRRRLAGDRRGRRGRVPHGGAARPDPRARSSSASRSMSRLSCQVPSRPRSYARITPTGRNPTAV